MTIFDLLFLFAFFAAAIALAFAGWTAIRGRFTRSRAILVRLAAAIASYSVVVILVSLASPRRAVNRGQDRCFDDWCIAVAGVTRAAGALYQVDLRLSSRARRVAQRETGLRVHLMDERGNTYEPEAAPSQPPFDTRLQPGESITTTRVFRVSPDAHVLGLVVAHGLGPGLAVISDDESLFHKKTIFRLD